MTLLRGVIGALTSSILRLAITAGVLLAVYFLLLKPAFDSGRHSVEHSLHSLEKKASPKRLEHCISHADGDVGQIKRCTRIF